MVPRVCDAGALRAARRALSHPLHTSCAVKMEPTRYYGKRDLRLDWSSPVLPRTTTRRLHDFILLLFLSSLCVFDEKNNKTHSRRSRGPVPRGIDPIQSVLKCSSIAKNLSRNPRDPNVKAQRLKTRDTETCKARSLCSLSSSRGRKVRRAFADRQGNDYF